MQFSLGWRSVLAVTATLFVISPFLSFAQPADADDLVLVLVRHADKAAQPADDPPLTAAGAKRAQELATALPSFLNVRPVSASQNGIVVQASASVLGHRVTLHLGVLADAGRVIVRPEGLIFGSLATITVFSDPRIYVESVGGELHGERYLLTARARLS